MEKGLVSIQKDGHYILHISVDIIGHAGNGVEHKGQLIAIGWFINPDKNSNQRRDRNTYDCHPVWQGIQRKHIGHMAP